MQQGFVIRVSRRGEKGTGEGILDRERRGEERRGEERRGEERRGEERRGEERRGEERRGEERRGEERRGEERVQQIVLLRMYCYRQCVLPIIASNETTSAEDDTTLRVQMMPSGP